MVLYKLPAGERWSRAAGVKRGWDIPAPPGCVSNGGTDMRQRKTTTRRWMTKRHFDSYRAAHARALELRWRKRRISYAAQHVPHCGNAACCWRFIAHVPARLGAALLRARTQTTPSSAPPACLDVARLALSSNIWRGVRANNGAGGSPNMKPLSQTNISRRWTGRRAGDSRISRVERFHLGDMVLEGDGFNIAGIQRQLFSSYSRSRA